MSSLSPHWWRMGAMKRLITVVVLSTALRTSLMPVFRPTIPVLLRSVYISPFLEAESWTYLRLLVTTSLSPSDPISKWHSSLPSIKLCGSLLPLAMLSPPEFHTLTKTAPHRPSCVWFLPSDIFSTNFCRPKNGTTVILASGAYGSPAILERSGVGNKTLLSSLGIPSIIDLAGVGENLQERMYRSYAMVFRYWIRAI